MINKVIDPNVAANAYTNTQNAGPGVSDDDGVSFAGMLKRAGEDIIDTMREGEEMSAKAITEEADLNEVIQAVNSAEMTLQTVVAMRDKLVSAYQEIMRMPI